MLRVTQAVIPPGRFILHKSQYSFRRYDEGCHDIYVKCQVLQPVPHAFYKVRSFFSTGEVGNVPETRDLASNWSIHLDHNFGMSKLQEQVPSMCLKFLVVQYWQS